MITAVPKKIFSNKFEFLEDGQSAGSIKIAGWGDKAEIYIPDLTLSGYRKGVVKPRYFLERDGQVIASAFKPSIWSNRLELQLGKQTCEMKRKSIFSTTFVVVSGGEQIGYVEREGWFTFRSIIELPQSWPLPLQIFVFWVVLVMWKKMRASAG